MSKKKPPQYFDPPTTQEMQEMDKKIARAKLAARKKRKLKIEPYVATVSTCLRAGKSSRNIVRIVWMKHKMQLSKDTVLRFAGVYASNLGTGAQRDQV